LTDVDGKPDGGRVALQVKSGSTYFGKPKKDRKGNVGGWWRAVPARHRRYWLDQSLPVYVVLVDLETREWFYERITAESCRPSGKNYRVLVPTGNGLERAASEWRQGAETYRALTGKGHALLGKLLPPACAEALERLGAVDVTLADMVAATLSGGEPELNVEFLLSAAESWLRDSPSLVFVAVGAYASEHELFDLAADSLEHAASRSDIDDERRGVLLSFAGGCSGGRDDNRAERLLTAAVATGSQIGTRRAELIRTMHDPALLSAFRPEQWRQISDTALAAQAALTAALHHQASGRLDSAIAEVSRSREHQPLATRPMMLHADLLLSRAGTSQAHPGDRAAALDLTRHVAEQRRLWNGPMQSVFALEIKALTLLSRRG
jgi:hypothetical protein